jgi:hypothetical protein
MDYIRPVNPTLYARNLECPITSEELLTALQAGARHKLPGINSFGLEFYTANWDTISTDLLQLLNHMFLNNNISSQLKHGIIVCLPKQNRNPTPDGYRPISLFNTEYKLLAQIMARRLRPILAEQLQTSQFCGIPEKSILDAISSVRDILAHSANTGTPRCLLTLDFQQAFDRISHTYLFNILLRYGISPWFVDRIRALYDRATASVQINGHLAGTFSIQSGVRQGCPLSMVLYALCLHPFLRSLEETLPGIPIG